MQNRNIEITVAFDASIEDKQFYLLDTVLFNINKIQLINSIDMMLKTYIDATGSNLKYVEAVDFNTREAIDLPDSYPKPVTGGVIKAK